MQKKKECKHNFIEKNPITGDPLVPHLICTKCGVTFKDFGVLENRIRDKAR